MKVFKLQLNHYDSALLHKFFATVFLHSFLERKTKIDVSWFLLPTLAAFEQAKYVIDMVLRDMDLSGVIGSEQGKKYEAILRGINQWYDEMGGNY